MHIASISIRLPKTHRSPGVAGSIAKGALGNAAAGTTGVSKGAAGAPGALGGLLGKKKKPK